jgi:hypothetical protein
VIVPGTTISFYYDLARSLFQPTDEYRIALYTRDAKLSPLTDKYTTDGEVIGAPGYVAGGQVLTGMTVTMDGPIAVIDWADVVWPSSTIVARGGLIFNATRNRSVVVLDFGPSPAGDERGYSSTNGNFLVPFPEPNASTGLVRIGG